jgi:hypothetical protein
MSYLCMYISTYVCNSTSYSAMNENRRKKWFLLKHALVITSNYHFTIAVASRSRGMVYSKSFRPQRVKLIGISFFDGFL